MGKQDKTNCMRVLESRKIPYTPHLYEADPTLTGGDIAALLGEEPSQVFKTLVTVGADRDKLEPEHFRKWVEFCRERGLGCDFNPTFFSHPMCDPLTLSSPDAQTRKFWINHGKACIRISSYLRRSCRFQGSQGF